eukprot:XP_001704839.1 Hypothetical protein GL50803_87497 [Giardia lamblia ATCC 50803]
MDDRKYQAASLGIEDRNEPIDDNTRCTRIISVQHPEVICQGVIDYYYLASEQISDGGWSDVCELVHT